MWEINNYDQLITALVSFVLGAVFSVVYDFFKAARLSSHHGILRVFFEDVIYSLFCTFLTFCLFILRTNGQVRGFCLFSIALGFAAARWLISPVLVRILRFVFRGVFTAFAIFRQFFDSIRLKIESAWVKIFKKFSETSKKVLKGIKRMVYNRLLERSAEKAAKQAASK